MSKIYFSNAQFRVVSFQEKHLTQAYVNWLNDTEVVRLSEQRHQTHGDLIDSPFNPSLRSVTLKFRNRFIKIFNNFYFNIKQIIHLSESN